MAHSYLEYIRLKAIISTLRFFDWEAWTTASPSPDDAFTITCRDAKRTVKVNVCKCRRLNRLPGGGPHISTTRARLQPRRADHPRSPGKPHDTLPRPPKLERWCLRFLRARRRRGLLSPRCSQERLHRPRRQLRARARASLPRGARRRRRSHHACSRSPGRVRRRECSPLRVQLRREHCSRGGIGGRGVGSPEGGSSRRGGVLPADGHECRAGG
jgi:hypothetical protein